MKRFLIMALVVFFAANSIVVSAWAKPCQMVSSSFQYTQDIQAQQASDMPCHQGKEEQKSTEHCKGLCLCLHVMAHQTPLLTDDAVVYHIVALSTRIAYSNEALASRVTSPLLRPPILIS